MGDSLLTDVFGMMDAQNRDSATEIYHRERFTEVAAENPNLKLTMEMFVEDGANGKLWSKFKFLDAGMTVLLRDPM